MKIGTCEINAEDVLQALENEKILNLATCAGDRVTIRPMSHVNDGLTVFFQTGEDSLKVKQIQQNPLVAMCVGTYEIEGKASIIGHPLAEENQFFIEKLKIKHLNAFERWSACDDEVVIKVEPRKIRQWQYIDGKPFLAEISFTE